MTATKLQNRLSLPCFGFVCVGNCCYKDRCKFIHDDRLNNTLTSHNCHEQHKANLNINCSSKDDSFFYPMMHSFPKDKEKEENLLKYHVDAEKTDMYTFSIWKMFTTIVPIHNYINNLQENANVSESSIEQIYEIGTDVYHNSRRLPVFRYLSLGLPVPNANYQ